MLFKGVAILYYILCEMLFRIHSFITNFIVLLVFLSADFWVVKNVTGRLLVGLRWWNDTSEGDGWRFESLEEGQRQLNSTDKFFFWTGLIGNAAIWILYTIFTLFQPSHWVYLLICGIALTMGGSNVYGYFKCSKEARRVVQQYAERYTQEAIMTAASSGLQSAMRSGNTNRANV